MQAIRGSGNAVKIWINMGNRIMEGKWKDNITESIRKKMKKHKHFKLPWIIVLMTVTFLYDIVAYFAHNTKRFASIAAVFLFFIISSSFSFPYMQEEMQDAAEESERAQEIEQSYEYEPTVLDITADNVLDDDDVLTGYDNDELDVQDEIDQFSLDDILKANEISNTDKIEEDSSEILTADDWRLVLVNKQHPIPDDYTFTLGTITGNMKCDIRIIDDLMAMLEAAKADGIDLVICSPYRDYNRQTVLFDRKIDYYMDKGYSYMEAYKIASITVTVPGASEHQIGLALDIVSNDYTYLETGFGDTEAGKWLNKHSCEYGFILRYPLGKEYITGIQYEPWHFRYVGKKAATEIMSRGITLEEFLEDL